ncbi:MULTISPECIES: DUF4383 domain-containing protein [Kribbella]|uniref:DUF4383 domain-containing protein n=1 Tax=Kribbella karoonensis TaxID=324851 RepID=A0ABN2D0C4_9ACTN
MERQPPSTNATPTQEMSLWIAGALLTLAWFGFLTLLAGQVESLDLGERLFGLFDVSVVHNCLHLLLAAAALLSARSYRGSQRFLMCAGIAMMTLTIYSQIDSAPALPHLVPIGPADGVLHALVGLAMIVAAILPMSLGRTSPPRP